MWQPLLTIVGGKALIPIKPKSRFLSDPLQSCHSEEFQIGNLFP
jgi:hypothetical protein